MNQYLIFFMLTLWREKYSALTPMPTSVIPSVKSVFCMVLAAALSITFSGLFDKCAILKFFGVVVVIFCLITVVIVLKVG